MARKFTSAITATAILISQATAPLGAQTRPAPVPQAPVTKPAPVEPVPLPQPVPDRPTPLPQPVPDRPTPLPQPVPGGPQIQPPRPTYPGNNDDFAGRITCESRNGRLQRCAARTDNRVVLLTRASGSCTQGRTWGYDRQSIWVSGNCSGTFGYGYRYGGGGGTVPPYPGNGGYANSLRCESRDNRLERCNVRTENRVTLVKRHNGTCTQSRTWGYNQRSIWVSSNCRATFAYGYGSYYPDRDKDDGPSTGLIIGGVAVAAGLIALLASKSKKQDSGQTGTTQPAPAPAPETPPTYPAGPPAAITADLSSLPADSRPSMQTCLFEASRQIGATGGTRLRFDRLVNIEPGNGGWRFRAETTASYPDGDRQIPIYCRATPTKVVQLDFTS